MDRGPIAAQQSLARTIEIDDSGGHGITLLRAICDRFADQLVRQWRRQFLDSDETLGVHPCPSDGDGEPDRSRQESGPN